MADYDSRATPADLSPVHFQAICEHAADMILVTEADPVDKPGPRIVYANRAAEEITGLSRDFLRGKTPRILQGPGTDRAALNRLRSALEAGEPVHERMLNYHADGTAYWIDIHLHPLHDADGRVTHFVAIERDVTYEQRLQDQLKANEQFLQTVFDNAFEGIVVVDAKRDSSGTIVDFDNKLFNRAAVKILGLSPDDWQGRTLLELFPGHVREGVFEQYRQCVDTGTALNQEIPYSHEGLDGYFMVAGTPVGDRLILTFVDVTDRRRYEELLRQRKDEAEREARHDDLTGLPNRTQFFERGHQLLLIGEREQRPTFVLFLDLNGFKPINDGYGHEAGDAVLQRLGRRLEATARSSDLVSRLGGDEFAVMGLVTHARGRQDCLTVGRRLLAQVEEPYVLPDGTTATLGAALGAAFVPADAQTLTGALECADQAMYRAKRAGIVDRPVLYDEVEPVAVQPD